MGVDALLAVIASEFKHTRCGTTPESKFEHVRKRATPDSLVKHRGRVMPV